jgi:hypothetical protein
MAGFRLVELAHIVTVTFGVAQLAQRGRHYIFILYLSTK